MYPNSCLVTEKKERKENALNSCWRGVSLRLGMEELFVAILSMLLVVALVPLYLWKRRLDSRSPNEHEEEPQVIFYFFIFLLC